MCFTPISSIYSNSCICSLSHHRTRRCKHTFYRKMIWDKHLTLTPKFFRGHWRTDIIFRYVWMLKSNLECGHPWHQGAGPMTPLHVHFRGGVLPLANNRLCERISQISDWWRSTSSSHYGNLLAMYTNENYCSSFLSSVEILITMGN